MKGIIIFSLLVAAVCATPIDWDPSCECVPTPPPKPVIRCPECVNGECTPNMCNLAVLLPYPGDCSKFCMCDHGGAIEFDCPAGTVFDAYLGQCVWPHQSSCSNDDPFPGCTATTTTTTRPPTTTRTTSKPPTTTTTTTRPPTTTRTTTTRPPTTTTTTKPPTTTTTTTRPPTTTRTTTTKPPTTTTTTKPPTTTTTTTRPPTTTRTTTTKPPTTTTTTKPTTTVPDDPTPTLPCQTDPPGPTVRCPECVNQHCSVNMCNQAVPIPFPNDCTKFCLCDLSGSIEMNCPAGTIFSPEHLVCVWPHEYSCSDSDPYPGCPRSLF